MRLKCGSDEAVELTAIFPLIPVEFHSAIAPSR